MHPSFSVAVLGLGVTGSVGLGFRLTDSMLGFTLRFRIMKRTVGTADLRNSGLELNPRPLVRRLTRYVTKVADDKHVGVGHEAVLPVAGKLHTAGRKALHRDQYSDVCMAGRCYTDDCRVV